MHRLDQIANSFSNSNGKIREVYSGLMNQIINKSISDPNIFGVNDKVLVTFFEGTNNRFLSKVPGAGKIIFAASNISVVPGVPYLGKVIHPIGKSVCFFEPLVDGTAISHSFLRYILEEKKINAIKEILSHTWHVPDIKDRTPLPDPGWSNPIQNTQRTGSYGQSIGSFGQALSSQSDILRLRREKEEFERKYSSECRDHRDTQSRYKTVIDDMMKLVETVTDDNEVLSAKLKASSGATDINIWEILQCTPQSDKKEISSNLKIALTLYHPDKVSRAGKYIQDLANSITIKLLDFKRNLK